MYLLKEELTIRFDKKCYRSRLWLQVKSCKKIKSSSAIFYDTYFRFEVEQQQRQRRQRQRRRCRRRCHRWRRLFPCRDCQWFLSAKHRASNKNCHRDRERDRTTIVSLPPLSRNTDTFSVLDSCRKKFPKSSRNIVPEKHEFFRDELRVVLISARK